MGNTTSADEGVTTPTTEWTRIYPSLEQDDEPEEFSQSVFVLPTHHSDKSKMCRRPRRQRHLSNSNPLAGSGTKRLGYRGCRKRTEAARWLAKERENRLENEKDQFLSAAAAGDMDTVVRLVSMGVNVDTADENHLTALHYAAMNARTKVLEFLIDSGADVNATDTKGGFSPLHWAVINDQPFLFHEERVDACIEALVRGGGKINAKDFNQATPLHFAARMDNHALVDTLMRLGADPNETDVLGRTCARLAKSPSTKILILKLIDLKMKAFYHVLEIPAAGY